MHEAAINESAENPNFEASRHHLGFTERRAGALIAPSLTAHVAAKLGREAAIMKERRKVREARGGAGAAKAKAKSGASAPSGP